MNRTVEVENAEQLSALVRDCAGRDEPIVDYGVAHSGLGHPPPTNGVRPVLAGGAVEHYERDMTVRASAGTTIGTLHEVLARQDQFLPVDADPVLTLGEVICHNVYGPLRVTYGAIRDLLLGLRYVDGEGGQNHVGGRTVKNVAGYDVTRFMVGSLGQFGQVYEATLRTYAIPPRVFTVELRFENAAALDSMLTPWLLTDAAPGWLLLNMADTHAVVRVGFLGRASACEVQLRALEALVARWADVTILGTARRSMEQDSVERSARRRWRREASGLCKIIVPPAHTGTACRELTEWAADHALINVDALPAHGCVFAGGTIDAPFARQMDEQIARIVEPMAGVRLWYSRPDGAEQIDPFGPPRDDLAMLSALKQAMDPHDLFNPGRYLPAGKLR